jgi:tRNA G10  N-methylase Trm11
MASANIHPFPARMASDIALAHVKELPRESLVLDPMMGSGTVLVAAAKAGHRCVGFDLDPLAVMMSRVATSQLDGARFTSLLDLLLKQARRVDLRRAKLPWVDNETADFISYWFAPDQRRALTRLALVLNRTPALSDGSPEANAIRLAVSKLIVTKDTGASLARDISHSRPHKVCDDNDFDVFEGLKICAARLQHRLAIGATTHRPSIRMGDARKLPRVRDRSIDLLLTSPPYLNAIDYMRGHRMSLVWLGYNLATLRQIRSTSIGAERAADVGTRFGEVSRVSGALGQIERLPLRYQNMILRYCTDLISIAKQTSRVMKPSGKAVFVIGNSCLKDVFISNSRGLEIAARVAGMKLIDEVERELPERNRYLPIPTKRSGLGRRMRVETVMTFGHA